MNKDARHMSSSKIIVREGPQADNPRKHKCHGNNKHIANKGSFLKTSGTKQMAVMFTPKELQAIDMQYKPAWYMLPAVCDVSKTASYSVFRSSGAC